jgi:hypothetical protein
MAAQAGDFSKDPKAADLKGRREDDGGGWAHNRR